jgi:hypothetical protein
MIISTKMMITITPAMRAALYGPGFFWSGAITGSSPDTE